MMRVKTSVREWRMRLLENHRGMLMFRPGFDTTEDVITTYLRPFDYVFMPFEASS